MRTKSLHAATKTLHSLLNGSTGAFYSLEGDLGLGGRPIFSLECAMKGFLETTDLTPT